MNGGILSDWDVAVPENEIPHVEEHRAETVGDALVAGSKSALVVHLIGVVANLHVIVWLSCIHWHIIGVGVLV
jgi:hypothetical protein